MKNFDAAPTSIQELYGDEAFRNQVLETFQNINKQSSAIIGDPSMVVGSLSDILTLSSNEIEPYFWVGSDAKKL